MTTNHDRYLVTLTTALGLLALLSGHALADPPSLVRYVARLTDAAGVPLTGVHDLTFAIYGQETGGTPLWLEGPSSVGLGNGSLDVLLGRVTALTSSVLAAPDRWLEVTVDGSTLAPRQRLSSVPYALTTDRLGTKTLAEVEADVDADIAAHTLLADEHREHASLEESAEIDSDIAAHGVSPGAHPGLISGVTAGAGLTGGGSTGDIAVSIATSGVDAAMLDTDSVGALEIQANAVGGSEIALRAVTNAKLGLTVYGPTSASSSTNQISATTSTEMTRNLGNRQFCALVKTQLANMVNSGTNVWCRIYWESSLSAWLLRARSNGTTTITCQAACF